MQSLDCNYKAIRKSKQKYYVNVIKIHNKGDKMLIIDWFSMARWIKISARELKIKTSEHLKNILKN